MITTRRSNWVVALMLVLTITYPSLTLTLSTSSSKDTPQKHTPMANQHPQGCGPSGWTFRCGCGSSPTGHWNWGVGDPGGATFSFE
ncbi:hypothetical protein PRUPE_1G505000 [Prunus persica]|uniref:Uncharacterized protein n=1 Tax=Prunus persica TaxID=3760 RepID=A0A251RG21_PRUPE|nr:hypothetical protein PRUPE_1G505000 [Prunus persica]